MSKGTECTLSQKKKRVFVKVKSTQLEIIEMKYLAKASRRRAEMVFIEIK